MRAIIKFLPIVCLFLSPLLNGAELAKGDVITLTLRGVDPSEGSRVNGDYTVNDQGGIRLPLLEKSIPAVGLTATQLARKAESLYRDSKIYQNPAIEIVFKKAVVAGGAKVFMGGRVRSSGNVPYQQGLTVIQAIDSAGGPDEFAGRNIILIREGSQYVLDFNQLDHLNIILEPNDSLRIDQKPALFDRWKGTPEGVAPLMN